VNQIENHPALPQNDIVKVCKEKGIHMMAYSPLGSTGGPLFKEEKVVKVAEKHGVEPAVVLLSWHSKSLFSCTALCHCLFTLFSVCQTEKLY
jgi:glycerol 2-dehydrogenase (NADP+)